MIMTHQNRPLHQDRPPTRHRKRGLRAEAAAERERAIEALVKNAKATGQPTDHLYWTLQYDFELAPMTTNLQQLKEVGVSMPREEGLCDRDVQQNLWEVIETLADLGVYLLHTDHLSDRELYRMLEQEVLRDKVRDLPPSQGVIEFVDLGIRAEGVTQAVVQRDRFLPKPEQPHVFPTG